MKHFMTKLMLGAMLLTGIAGAATKDDGDHTDPALARKVAHEVRMYSRYTIWDNINIQVNEGNVELMGQVSQPFNNDKGSASNVPAPGIIEVDFFETKDYNRIHKREISSFFIYTLIAVQVLGAPAACQNLYGN